MHTTTMRAWAVFLLALIPLGSALADRFAYVTSTDYDYVRDVSVLDLTTTTVIAEIATGEDSPEGIAITPDGRTAYVASNTENLGDDSVLVVDLVSREIVDRVVLGQVRWPKGVAITPDGARVYVASRSVAVIDTTTRAVTDTIEVGGRALEVAVSPDGTHAYVASPSDFPDAGTLSVIETKTNTVVAATEIDHGPWGVAVTPDGSRVYVTNYYSVTSIDAKTARIVATIPVAGGLIKPIVITPDGARAYVGGFTGVVSVIDTKTNTVGNTISGVVREPNGMAVTPDGTRVYVVGDLGEIDVIDTTTNTVVDRTGVNATATAIAIAP